jgi:hypothetical protein
MWEYVYECVNALLRLFQSFALGRANVAGRVSNGTRQNVLMRECENVDCADLVLTWCRLGADLFFSRMEWKRRPAGVLRAASLCVGMAVT